MQMSDNVKRILEGSFAAIFIYLVLTHSKEFSTVISSGGAVFNNSVRTLEGR